MGRRLRALKTEELCLRFSLSALFRTFYCTFFFQIRALISLILLGNLPQWLAGAAYSHPTPNESNFWRGPRELLLILWNIPSTSLWKFINNNERLPCRRLGSKTSNLVEMRKS